MDNVSYKILSLLQTDSRMTYTDISKEVNLSIPSVKEKINKMIEKGIIKNSTIDIDFEKLGRHIRAIVMIDVKFNRYKKFMEFCYENPYITDFYRVVGSYNATIFVAIEDSDSFEKFIDKIKNFGTCQTSIVTSTCFKNKI